MRTFKKTLGLFLALLMLFSALPVSATGHWADEYIAYAETNGLWYESKVDSPDKAITRAELASLASNTIEMPHLTKEIDLFDDVTAASRHYYDILAMSLGGVMVGDNRKFRPDDHITREEMAVISERLYAIVDHTKTNAEIVKNRFADFEEISLWAQNAVYSAVEKKNMHGIAGKTFAPKKSLSRAEAIKVMVKLDEHYKEKKESEKEPDFMVYDAPTSVISSPKTAFPVYQSAGVVNVLGIAGFAVLGYYEGGIGEVYVARTTTVPEGGAETNGQSTYIPPTAVAVVYDPDGDSIATVEFPIMESGKFAKIIVPGCEKTGIYTVRIMNGRTGDTFEIGMKETEYWGVRGERHLGATSTLPNPAYVYAQSKHEFVHVGINGEQTVYLKDLEDNVIGVTEPKTRTNPFVKNEMNLGKVLKGDTVYKIEFPENFNSGVVIDGIPGLMCPTKEAAEFLQGGWIKGEDGTLYQGIIQKRARDEIVRLAKEKNLEVKHDKPEELPEVKNPLAEAMLFGIYAPISGLGNAVKWQVTDPEDPYCGRVYSLSEYENGKAAEEFDYQSCNFYRLGDHGVGGMTAAATVPLELNYFYMNDALIQRSAMAILYWITLLSEDGYVRQNSLSTSYYPLTAGMFILHYALEAYITIEDYLDPETKAVLDSAFTLLLDKQGDYRGQGVTNQGLFFIADRLFWYQYTGIERHHDTFKRAINCLIEENGRWNRNYHITDGYFVESGLDSSYNYMNMQEYYCIFRHYLETPGADSEVLEKMYKTVEETLYFESHFCVPQPSYSTIYTGRGSAAPNSFTSRSGKVTLGSGANASYEQLTNIFPIAARRFQVKNAPAYSETYPYIINNEEWALDFIKSHWDKYENYFEGQNRIGNVWINQCLEARESEEQATPCPLPCEEPDGTIWDRPGFMFFKHSGMYFAIAYNCPNITSFTPTRNKKSVMGGAPAIVWNEESGSSICSQKHLTGTATPVLSSDVLSACFFGDDGNGNITFASGREDSHITWIEEGKEFEIGGMMPDDGRNVSWHYRLEDDGVALTASISAINPGEQVYLNLPFVANDLDNGAEQKLEDNSFSFIFGGKEVSYKWEEKTPAELLEPIDGIQGVRFTRLRIKVPQNGRLTFKISLNDVQ